MFAISNEENRLSGVDLHNWSTMKEAGWYCYGTIIGESITRDTKSEKAVSLRFVFWIMIPIFSNNNKPFRWVIAFWILYCLVISASYSGELRAYMINPSYTSPIRDPIQ